MTDTNTSLEQLKIGIGNEEATTQLKPAKVKIVGGKIEEVGEKKTKKVVCLCKHPEKQEPISISAVKYENKGKLESTGLWLNQDSKGLIKKSSALAVFMQHIGASTIDQLVGKDIETTTDDKGYLCFKAY